MKSKEVYIRLSDLKEIDVRDLESLVFHLLRGGLFNQVKVKQLLHRHMCVTVCRQNV